MKSALKLLSVSGAGIKPYIEDLADLRINLFREYPYLYDGNMQYEKEYLQTYVKCEQSKILLVQDQNKVVGATTCIPLKNETIEIQEPFLQRGLDVNDFFYFGESLLLPKYRKQGLYRKFFTFRENAAKKQGYAKAIFMSIVRPDNHTKRPKDYQPLDAVWQHFGYHAMPNWLVFFSWKEIDEMEEFKKPLMIWIKNL